MTSATAITSAPLSVEAVLRAVEGPGAGAVTTFVGLVRDHNVGRKVLWLDYEAYAPLARAIIGGLVLLVRDPERTSALTGTFRILGLVLGKKDDDD